MKRLPEHLEQALYEFANDVKLTWRETVPLAKTGLLILDQDEQSGYKITEAGWEYLYRIHPDLFGTEVARIQTSEAVPRGSGEEATRDEFIKEWKEDSGDPDWAERIRQSPEL